MNEQGLIVVLLSLMVFMFVAPVVIISLLKRVRKNQSPSELHHKNMTDPKVAASQTQKEAQKQKREQSRARLREMFLENADRTINNVSSECIIRGLWIAAANLSPLIVNRSLDTTRLPSFWAIFVMCVGVGLGAVLLVAGIFIGRRQRWALVTARIVVLAYAMITLFLAVTGLTTANLQTWIGLLFDLFILFMMNGIFSVGTADVGFD